MAGVRGKCPQCGKPVLIGPENPWRPFCSDRCRLIDLGGWLAERHVIAGEEPAPDGEQREPADKPS
jgi:endogenous inhibitor of DNA gyrase (YacG/DUF329 family)